MKRNQQESGISRNRSFQLFIVCYGALLKLYGYKLIAFFFFDNCSEISPNQQIKDLIIDQTGIMATLKSDLTGIVIFLSLFLKEQCEGLLGKSKKIILYTIRSFSNSYFPITSRSKYL